MRPVKTTRRITYWLFLGENVVTSVRMDEGAEDQDVRCKAIADLDAHPFLCPREIDPIGQRYRILNSEIRTYPNEG